MYCQAMEAPQFTQKDLKNIPREKLVDLTLALLNNQAELISQVREKG